MKTKAANPEREHAGRGVAPRLSDELSDAVTAAALALRQEFRAELADPRVADRIARRIRLALSTGSGQGRRRSREVRTALQMLNDGKQWKEIYSVVIAEYAQMDKANRWHNEYRLRRNVRSVRGRAAKKAARFEGLRARAARIRGALHEESLPQS